MGDNMTKKKIIGILKIVIVFLFIFIILPLGVMGILYNTNESFKNTANKYLRSFPGVVGDYFNQYPTSTEIEDKKYYVADYYNSLDDNAAADKLYIIKKQDEELYYEIIKEMNKINPKKSQLIINKVRDIELRKNLLISIYDEINTEKENELQKKVKQIEAMDIAMAKNLMIEYYNNGNYTEVKDIFNNLTIDMTANILYYTNSDLKDYVLNNLKNDNKLKVTLKLKEKRITYEKLIRQSQVYQVKDKFDAFSEIGNDEKYNYDELSVIYLNLTTEKAAEILALVKNKEFIEELFDNMRNNELLRDIIESRTVKIASQIESIKNYNKKIQNLVGVYQQMNSDRVANIIEKMYKNNTKLSIDVLSNMTKSKVAEILDNIDAGIANEISTKLAL